VPGPPKSAAGTQVLAVPAGVMVVLRQQLSEFHVDGDELIFTGLLGAPLHSNNFPRALRGP
jgi:hypothetical protein